MCLWFDFFFFFWFDFLNQYLLLRSNSALILKTQEFETLRLSFPGWGWVRIKGIQSCHT